MTTATKLAQRTVHTGTFEGAQQQRLAQDVARKTNSHADMLNALVNRSYAPLGIDTTAPLFTYATLLTAPITTVLASGYLLITFSASGFHGTALGGTFFQVVVDGVIKKGCGTTVPLGYSFSASLVLRVPVTRGAHSVLVQWNTDANTASISAASTVEHHAHLLVQEAA